MQTTPMAAECRANQHKRALQAELTTANRDAIQKELWKIATTWRAHDFFQKRSKHFFYLPCRNPLSDKAKVDNFNQLQHSPAKGTKPD